MNSNSPAKEPFLAQNAASNVSCDDSRLKFDKGLKNGPNFLNCQEKMPLLNEKLGESSGSLHAMHAVPNFSLGRCVINVPGHKIDFLPKMLTEPSNLHELSLKSALRPSRTFGKGEAVHLKRICAKSTACPGKDRPVTRGGCVEKDDNSAHSFAEPRFKWSSSYALHKPRKRGHKSDIQLPHCMRHKSVHGIAGFSANQFSMESGLSAGAQCDCRLCRMQDPWPLPNPHTATKISQAAGMDGQDILEPQKLGSMCQWCGQTFGDQHQVIGEKCPWDQSNAGLLHPCHVDSLDPAGGMLPGYVRVASTDPCHSCFITSREQGVQVSNWSLSTVSTCSGPMCRICHSPGDKTEPLMSPCRCSGTLKFVHSTCLLRWLEISRRKLHRAPHCELCGYKYQRHKIMRIRKLHCPSCTKRDKMLHFTFLAAIFVMILCAATTIFCFKAERQHKSVTSTDKIELSSQEVMTLVCGVTFFCAFFLSMYVQVKAQTTIYKLLMRFWLMNQEWRIDEYNPGRDPQLDGSKKSRIRPEPSTATRRSTSV